jgi:hypothetical protein
MITGKIQIVEIFDLKHNLKHFDLSVLNFEVSDTSSTTVASVNSNMYQ